MKDSDFKGLMQGLSETAAFLKGKTVQDSLVRIPAEIDVAAIRIKTGLSQIAFAKRIGVPIGTLRNWEQGRRVPDGPARVLLALLMKNPRIVEDVLGIVA
jgi:putative transcriptional regulator